jgi:hypothetical protein
LQGFKNSTLLILPPPPPPPPSLIVPLAQGGTPALMQAGPASGDGS